MKKIQNKKTGHNQLRLVFSNQQDRGNHINIAGGGVVKYSQRKA